MTAPGSWVRPALRAWAALLAAALLFACGGGVGTGGTGDTPVVVASGPITEFGSIVVAGTRFEDEQASVLDDAGQAVARTGGELRLGMTVSVEGVALPNGDSATARTVNITTHVIGPVQAIDVQAGTLTVTGQNLQVNSATVFDTALPARLASLRSGDVIAAYALAEPVNGRLVVTRIEPAPRSANWRVRGTVGALDTAARTLRVGDSTFSYASVTNVPADLANGRTVNLRVGSSATAVLNVIAFDGAGGPPAEDSRRTIEASISAISADNVFIAGGLTIDARNAQIVPGNAALLVGARIEARGRIENGVLLAERVKIYSTADVDTRIYKVNGRIDALDTAAQTFVVRGTLVDYANAQFEGGTAAQLALGVRVRAEGPLAPDGTRVRATVVELR